MEKVKELLHNEDWHEIEILRNEIIGKKGSEKVKAVISKGIIDLTCDIQYILIPYEEDYLIYKVS